MDVIKILLAFGMIISLGIAIVALVQVNQIESGLTSQVKTVKNSVDQTNKQTEELQTNLEAHKESYKKDMIGSMNANCDIYSMPSSYSGDRATGNAICEERNAGTCMMVVAYGMLQNRNLIDECSFKGDTDSTVAYCCKI